MGRATSSAARLHSLSGDQRLRHYVAAVERRDWRLVQRLELTSPLSRSDRIDPTFLRRVDALRRLTYRVTVVLLAATSVIALAAPSRRPLVPWSVLMDPTDPADPAELEAAADAIRRDLRERVKDAAELWVAFDRFCAEVTDRPAAAVVSLFYPGELEWLRAIVERARRGGLGANRIDNAQQSMRMFWQRFVESEEEAVLILE